jgi:NAD(P)-dependent dehydrogenase (short-subunit alcohol dehydrogenase family)
MTTTQTIPTRPTPKVAVVTGASQGIGAGVVAAYRKLGWAVAAYRKLGWAVVATSRSIPVSDDPGLITEQGDVADPVTADRVVATVVERFGRLDALAAPPGFEDAIAWIAAAAPNEPSRWHVSFTVADWDQTVASDSGPRSLGKTTPNGRVQR